MRFGTKTKGVTALLLVLTMVMSMAAAPVMAQNSAINYDADASPNAEAHGQVTISDWRVGSDPLSYNSDNGEWTTHDGAVNESADNPYSFVATDVDFDDADAFPHDKDNVSAIDAGEWTTAGDNASKLSVTDTETAADVSAINVDTDGSLASTDQARATFSNFSVSSEENKRVLQMALDVNSIDSSTTVEVRVRDEDGDYYVAEINTTRSSGEDFITNASGEGIVYQRQLGEMSLVSNGGGTFDNIEEVRMVFTGGDADVDVQAVNVEKMGKWDYGTEMADTDSDDDLEENVIYENKVGGAIEVHDPVTMGPAFSDANIMDFSVEFTEDLEDADSEDVDMTFSEADNYPSFNWMFEGYGTMHLESAYDLSYSNVVLDDEASVPGQRYITVEYAEGVGDDTAFENISDSSWTDISGSYSSLGTNVTVDNSVTADTNMVLHYKFPVTEDQKAAMEDTSTGAAGPTGDSGGGLIDWLMGLPGAILAVFGAVGARAKGWV